MITLNRDILQAHWIAISPVFTIRNEHEYELAVKRLNALLDEIGADETHPLYSLLDTLGTVIANTKSDIIRCLAVVAPICCVFSWMSTP